MNTAADCNLSRKNNRLSRREWSWMEYLPWQRICWKTRAGAGQGDMCSCKWWWKEEEDLTKIQRSSIATYIGFGWGKRADNFSFEYFEFSIAKHTKFWEFHVRVREFMSTICLRVRIPLSPSISLYGHNQPRSASIRPNAIFTGLQLLFNVHGMIFKAWRSFMNAHPALEASMRIIYWWIYLFGSQRPSVVLTDFHLAGCPSLLSSSRTSVQWWRSPGQVCRSVTLSMQAVWKTNIAPS